LSASEPAGCGPAAIFITAERAVERAFSSRRVLRTGSAGLLAALAVVGWLPDTNASYLWLASAIAVAALLVARTEAPAGRVISMNLFVWAMLVRVAALGVLRLLALADGGVSLGPDSATYFVQSAALAASGLHTDTPAAVYFGTYDVAHYYLFAAAVRYFDADLFGLQVMNCGFIALVAPLALGFSRVILPWAAVLIAVAVAFNPGLVVLSTRDLLKDPSILCAMALLIWAVVRMTREPRVPVLAAYVLPGLAGALYLRTGRFYVFGYLEAAIVAAAVVMLVTRRTIFVRHAAVPLVALVFLLGEALPMLSVWPPSPRLILNHIDQVRGSPRMIRYSEGLADRLAVAGSPHVRAEPAEGGGRVGSLMISAANLFRRLYGPFVWIMPSTWSFKSLRSGDYLLYPGMLLWYGLLPFIGVGFVATAWRMLARAETRFGVIFLWFFTAVYFGQYLVVNLSYRQRDVMFPVLLVFACLGASIALQFTRWRRLYAVYWTLLGIVAGAHLTVRHMFPALN
jgi:hypothetical protein